MPNSITFCAHTWGSSQSRLFFSMQFHIIGSLGYLMNCSYLPPSMSSVTLSGLNILVSFWVLALPTLLSLPIPFTALMSSSTPLGLTIVLTAALLSDTAFCLARLHLSGNLGNIKVSVCLQRILNTLGYPWAMLCPEFIPGNWDPLHYPCFYVWRQCQCQWSC